MRIPPPLHALRNAPHVGIIMIADNGTVLYANPTVERFLGHRTSSVGRLLPPDLRGFHAGFVQSGESFASEILRCGVTGIETDISVYKVDGLGTPPRATVMVLEDATCRFSIDAWLNQALEGSAGEDASALADELAPSFQSLKGQDNSFRSTLLQAQKAAVTALPILIVGESGTGKEGLARAIHEASDRKEMPFVDINCAAIPDTLIESELFGYERGAFTGASGKGQRGMFDQAHGGTIFLDEIGDASLQLQAKILRVLQEGCFKRIGGAKNVVVDVRCIAATNKKLMDQISQGTFRQDLFYRLNTITIHLPPLRQRRSDIQLLAGHFLKEHSTEQGKQLAFSSKVMVLLEAYPWPGNVRELKGVVDYSATMASTSVLCIDSLPSFMKEVDSTAPAAPPDSQPDSRTGTGQGLLARALQEVERALIKEALARSRTRSDAIQTLGISRRTFYLKIKQYGLF